VRGKCLFNTSLTLLEFEFEETYKFPVFEIMFSTILIMAISLGKPTFTFSMLEGPEALVVYVASVLDIILPIAALFIAMTLSNTLAGGFERGDSKLFLSYPVSRGCLLFSRIVPTLFVSMASLLFSGILIASQFAPRLLFTVEFVLLFSGLGLYLLFFVSVVSLISVVSRNVKIASIVSIIFVIGTTTGINSRIMRFLPGFLSTLIKTYGNIFWEGISYSSNIEIPFEIVLFAHVIITVLALIITYIYYRYIMEV
jgi:ABC-type transport system involved in multi-copper enzyme maturation permease subunit